MHLFLICVFDTWALLLGLYGRYFYIVRTAAGIFLELTCVIPYSTGGREMHRDLNHFLNVFSIAPLEVVGRNRLWNLLSQGGGVAIIRGTVTFTNTQTHNNQATSVRLA